MTTENNDLPRPEGHRAVPADEAAFCGTGAPRPRDDERSREERRAERRVERERQRAEDEAKLREQLRADCNIACETWSYDRLVLLDAVVNSLAMTGVMSEAITDAFRNVTEQKSATALLAEMQKARRERERREREETPEGRKQTLLGEEAAITDESAPFQPKDDTIYDATLQDEDRAEA